MNYNIYVSFPKKNKIKNFFFQPKKKIFLLKQTIKTSRLVQPLLISKKYQLLYAGIRPFSKILTYKILLSGKLKFLKKTILIGNSNHLKLNTSKKLLFSSSYGGNCISILKINSDGIPIENIQTYFNIKGCHASHLLFKNKLLVVTSLLSDKIYFFKIKKNGIYKNKSIKSIKTPKKYGPRHITSYEKKKKKFLFILNEINGSIDIWNISIFKKKKKIIHIQNISLYNKKNKKFWSSDIHISPCKKFLYASDRNLNIITAFHINQKTGFLKIIDIYKTEIQPRSFFITSDGKLLIVVGEKSKFMSIYKINKISGKIILKEKFFIGKNPLWVCAWNHNK